MKKLRIVLATLLLISAGKLNAQIKIDSTAKPEETTFYDGSANIIYSPGTVIRTRSGHYYEITDKAKFKNKMEHPSVAVYKLNKKNYALVIQGLDIPIAANKIQDVIESNIDGDFKGWDGASSFKLVNGDVWVQDEYGSLYASLYRPKVIIYRISDGTYKMKVEGVEEIITVKRK
jgi:hypothetical protein